MKRNIFQFIVFAAFTFLLSSCLKDNVGEDWTSSLKGKAYATFQRAGTFNQSITPVATQSISVLVNIASDEPPAAATSVTVAVDAAQVDAMNAADTSMHYQLFPGISIANATLTIPAGSRVAYVVVNLLRADTLNFSTHWVLPISITAASGNSVIISANRKTVIYSLKIANIYEGLYHSVGYRNHPALGVIPVDKDKFLSTYDAITVATYPADYSPFDMEMTVNPDNSVTIFSNATTLFSDWTAGNPIRGITGGLNTYDPTAKVFTVWCYYNSGAPRLIHEVYTKK